MKEYTAKTVEEAVKLAAEELGVDEDRLICEVKEEKKSLFRKAATIAVYGDEDAASYAETYLHDSLAALGIEITTESVIEDSIIKVTIDSERNPRPHWARRQDAPSPQRTHQARREQQVQAPLPHPSRCRGIQGREIRQGRLHRQARSEPRPSFQGGCPTRSDDPGRTAHGPQCPLRHGTHQDRIDRRRLRSGDLHQVRRLTKIGTRGFRFLYIMCAR